MKLCLFLSAISLPLLAAALPATNINNAANANNPIIIEPVPQRANRLVGPETDDIAQCVSDSDCQFLYVCFGFVSLWSGLLETNCMLVFWGYEAEV